MRATAGSTWAATLDRSVGAADTTAGATIVDVAAAVATLSAAGANVEQVEVPRLAESMPLTRTYWRRVQSPSWNEWTPDKPHSLSNEEIERSIFEWDRFRRTLLSFMEPFDVLVCPVAEGPAPLHGTVGAQEYVYTLPFSLTGWPVVTLPAWCATCVGSPAAAMTRDSSMAIHSSVSSMRLTC